MTEMNADYLDLGRMIAGLCPQGFAEARLAARLDGAANAISLGCRLGDGSDAEVPLYELARDGLLARLEHIRAAEGRDWTSCTVTLSRGGGFAMEVAD
jgi:hypothetical protein